MNKVEMFRDHNLFVLEREINEFAAKHQIIHISITATRYGYHDYFTAAVLYKEEEV